MGSTGAGASDDRIAIENVNHPGKRTMVDGRKYRAMRAALVAVLPDGPPGLTEAAFREAVLAHLPEAVFPGGAAAGWWAKRRSHELARKPSDRAGQRTRACGLRWNSASGASETASWNTSNGAGTSSREWVLRTCAAAVWLSWTARRSESSRPCR